MEAGIKWCNADNELQASESRRVLCELAVHAQVHDEIVANGHNIAIIMLWRRVGCNASDWLAGWQLVFIEKNSGAAIIKLRPCGA